MKSFRHIMIATAVTLGVFSTVAYTSCKKNKCGSNVCNNGGVCTEDVCICATGYSDANCSTAWTSKWQGIYNCTQTCVPEANSSAWSSTIVDDGTNGGYTLDISNFDNSNITVLATVDSANGIYITPTAGVGIAGTGSYTDSANVVTISIDYTTSSGTGGGEYRCNIVMVKQ